MKYAILQNSMGQSTGQPWKNMNKKTTAANSYEALKNLEKYKIAPWSNFIIGFPGEDDETIKCTTDLIRNRIFGFYGLYVFNIRDQAMPALSNPLFNITYSDIDGEWNHMTMDSETAIRKRAEAYAAVVLGNERAINIDAFRGTGAESRFTPWSSGFKALKAIEKLAAITVFAEYFAEDTNEVRNAAIQELTLLGA